VDAADVLRELNRSEQLGSLLSQGVVTIEGPAEPA
jgi:hypothetical protein